VPDPLTGPRGPGVTVSGHLPPSAPLRHVRPLHRRARRARPAGSPPV